MNSILEDARAAQEAAKAKLLPLRDKLQNQMRDDVEAFMAKSFGPRWESSIAFATVELEESIAPDGITPRFSNVRIALVSRVRGNYLPVDVTIDRYRFEHYADITFATPGFFGRKISAIRAAELIDKSISR